VSTAPSIESPPSLVEQLDNLAELRPIPAVASRLLSACNDPNSDAKTLVEIIQCDPVISMRMLSVANSAMFGFSREIQTVQQAIVLLGFRAVRDMALSMGLCESFQDSAGHCDARDALWQHSLACAAIARLLAKHVPGVGPEEAFLAGIVHDIGKLVFYDLAPDEYRRLTESVEEAAILHAENASFGITHEQIGQRCGELWGLPDAINRTIGSHHNLEAAADNEALHALVSLADVLSKAWGIGAKEDPSFSASEAVVQSRLPLDEEALERIRQQATEEFHAVSEACKK
jgi:putative nucleotidyltransferase with HDIG domain